MLGFTWASEAPAMERTFILRAIFAEYVSGVAHLLRVVGKPY
jgi:hypothetical protein